MTESGGLKTEIGKEVCNTGRGDPGGIDRRKRRGRGVEDQPLPVAIQLHPGMGVTLADDVLPAQGPVFVGDIAGGVPGWNVCLAQEECGRGGKEFAVSRPGVEQKVCQGGGSLAPALEIE